ncbi:WD repeat-containing protein 26, partial [Mortierella sp. GBA30]
MKIPFITSPPGIGRSANTALTPSLTIHGRSVSNRTPSVSDEQDERGLNSHNKSTSSPRIRKRDKFFKIFRPAEPGVQLKPQPLRPETKNNHIKSASTGARGDDNNGASSVKISNTGTEALSTAEKAKALSDVFSKNVVRPVANIAVPKFRTRIDNTPQLALCGGLLLKNPVLSPPNETGLEYNSDQTKESTQDAPTDDAHRDWVKAMAQNPLEQDHIRWLLARMVQEFIDDAVKGPGVVTEIVLLGPVLDRVHYRKLLSCFIFEYEKSPILDIDLLHGLVQLVQCGSEGYLESDDLIKILSFFKIRLQQTHQHSITNQYHLTLAVSRVLDVMAKQEVKDLDRVELHEALGDVLSSLRESSDPFLIYQASYAFQALQCVPVNETVLQAVMRHSGAVAQSVIYISGVVNLNISGFLDGLGQLHKTLVETIDITKSAIDGARSLIESGQDVFLAIKNGIRSGKQRTWYAAIVGASALVQEGRLADFKVVVLEAVCRQSPEFQWGICQLLGEIAMDPTWGSTTQQEAVDFLVVLYTSDPEWGQDTSVEMWILTILRLVSEDTDQGIKAPIFLQQDIDRAEVYKLAKPCLLRSRLPLPVNSPLLVQIQKIPYIKREIYRLMEERVDDYKQSVYIQPQAKASIQASDKDTIPLMDKVKMFLDSDQQVFLVLGDSGAGKSTFSRRLEQELWVGYKQGGPIPLLINLPEINDPDKDLIDKQLQGFSEAIIKELKEQHRMILICDGYDEAQLKCNLHAANMLGGKRHMNIKMIVSCRSTHLPTDYHAQFEPRQSDKYSARAHNLFTQAVIVPFSKAQIEDYVTQFVRDSEVHKLTGDRPIWSAKDYMDKLDSIPDLMELVENPFLLNLSLKALPSLVEDGAIPAKITMTRLTLYDSFVDQWLKINCPKRHNKELSEPEQRALNDLSIEGFGSYATGFLKDLAAAIFREQGGKPVVEFKPISNRDPWKLEFFGPEPRSRFVRESCPLSRAGTKHQFIHISLLEYFYSRQVYETNETNGVLYGLSRNLASHPSSQGTLVSKPSIVQFLAEYVQRDSAFKQRLHQIIERSKTDDDASQAAANAISILVRAGKIFNGKDLRGIKIPGADLTGGQFDHAQLQGADLRGVNLTRTWLRKADLTGAQLSDVRFGERPFLKLQGFTVGASSPDGKMLALSCDSEIRVYKTTDSELLYTLCGHDGLITCLDFSSNGFQIASGSEDKTVRIWDLDLQGTRSCRVLKHSRCIRTLLFSPDGTRIAVARGKRVRVWDVESGIVVSTFKGHNMPVRSLAWSSDGCQVASISSGSIFVLLWDAKTGVEKDIHLAGDTGCYGGTQSIAISRDGLLATCDRNNNNNVHLRDLHSRNHEYRTLQGHTEPVICVNFSEDGRWIVTTSQDRTVRVWKTQSGSLACRLDGHKLAAKDAFFLNDREVVSIEPGGIVMLWELSIDTSRQGISGDAINSWLRGHSNQVTSIAYSPIKGKAILSCSRDGTVRQWNTRTRTNTVIASIRDFHSPSAVYSPDGQQIAVADGDLKIYRSQKGVYVPDLDDVHRTGNIISYSPCGSWIAYADEAAGKSKLWDLRSNKEHIMDCMEIEGTKLTFSPNGDFGLISLGAVFVGSIDGDEPSWCELDLDVDPRCLTYSPCGNMLAIGCEYGLVTIWDLWRDEKQHDFDGLKGMPLDIAWSPDGDWIACGCSGGTVQLLRVHRSLNETNSQQQQHQQVRLSCEVIVQGFAGAVASLDWNPVAYPLQFVTGSHDCSVCVWRLIEADETAETQVQLVWGSFSSRLVMVGARITDVKGLNEIQRKFLLQREAKEKKKVPLMKSVLQMTVRKDKEDDEEESDFEVENNNDDEEEDDEEECENEE